MWVKYLWKIQIIIEIIWETLKKYQKKKKFSCKITLLPWKT